MINYVKAYNKLVPLMNKLSQDNFDIWANDIHYQGYGFKVIFEKVWLEISISEEELLEKEKNQRAIYFVNVYKKLKNCPDLFDSVACKQVKEIKTFEVEEIENFIRKVAKSEKGE